MSSNLVNAIHRWTCGATRAQGSVVLTAIPDEEVGLLARPGCKLLFLTELWVPPCARGRGYAGTLLTAVAKWADSTQTDLWLYCSEHGPEPRFTREQLRGMYAKYGFKRCNLHSPDLEMVRYARA